MAENLPTKHELLALPDEAVGAKFVDTLDIDQEAHLLYMGDNWSNGVDVFDISTPQPKFVMTVKMKGPLYGVCVAKAVQKVYVGLARSVLGVIDINPDSASFHTVVALIKTGGHSNTDLVDFDPVHKKVYAANKHEGFIVGVDATTDEVVGRIDGLGLGLEQPRFNPVDGMVYLTDTEENVLYQIDPVRDVLVSTFEIGDACYPNGLAINPTNNQAILACDKPHTVVWDLNEQKVAAVIEETGGGDGAIYSAKADRFFFAASGYTTGPVMGILSGDPVKFLGNVSTARGASWVAFDETNNIVYAPAYGGPKPALLSFALPDLPS